MLCASAIVSLQDCSLNIAEGQIHDQIAPEQNCNDYHLLYAKHQNATLPPVCSLAVILI